MVAILPSGLRKTKFTVSPWRGWLNYAIKVAVKWLDQRSLKYMHTNWLDIPHTLNMSKEQKNRQKFLLTWRVKKAGHGLEQIFEWKVQVSTIFFYHKTQILWNDRMKKVYTSVVYFNQQTVAMHAICRFKLSCNFPGRGWSGHLAMSGSVLLLHRQFNLCVIVLTYFYKLAQSFRVYWFNQ